MLTLECNVPQVVTALQSAKSKQQDTPQTRLFRNCFTIVCINANFMADTDSDKAFYLYKPPLERRCAFGQTRFMRIFRGGGTTKIYFGTNFSFVMTCFFHVMFLFQPIRIPKAVVATNHMHAFAAHSRAFCEMKRDFIIPLSTCLSKTKNKDNLWPFLSINRPTSDVFPM